MKNQEFIDRLLEYRFIRNQDKINLSNFFEKFSLDNSFELSDGKVIIKHDGVHYTASVMNKNVLNRNLSFVSFDYGLSITSDVDHEYSVISFERSDDESPLIFDEFHYSYSDESGYYSYVLRNNLLYFRYLGADKKDTCAFEDWKYNFGVTEEGKMDGIVADTDVALSLSNNGQIVYDIYQDPKVGFRFMEEANK